MAEMTMALCSVEENGSSYELVKVTPPQSNDAPEVKVGAGAYCFVIDVSGSMNAAAQITTDDGDKVNHGWSQLDIAKHSTNTFVSSLGDDDYVSVVTYSDGANVLLNWIKCDSEGRDKAIAAIHSMRPERSTNLMAGITTGFSQFDGFPEADDALPKYALNLIITTDGMPSSQWHPARGRDGYHPLVRTLAKGLAKKRGPAAEPTVTTIGIGFQLDSELLTKMSAAFLHMPDPGQIGPFIVNLLAGVRSTARLPSPAGSAANAVSLRILPANAVAADASAIPGFSRSRTVEDDGVDEWVTVPLGSMLYDQPRHTVLKLKPGVAHTVSLVLNGAVIATVPSDQAAPASSLQEKQFAIQKMRLEAVEALDAAAAAGTAGSGAEAIAAPISEILAKIRASAYGEEDAMKRLANTIESECVLGADVENFRKWGGHYFRTLPCMLRAEKRSNFRDECLQHFGHDARNREGLFETESNAAEMRFATLTPPEPSLLRPAAPPPVYGGAAPGAYAAPPPRAAPVALPDEFMRGGGCFGPDSTVLRVASRGNADADAAPRAVPVSAVQPGDAVMCADGRIARVRCVVLTECAGGRAMLTRLPNGTELTEWHPIRDPTGRWRFPHMLGQRIVRQASHVYNFVLEPGHPALLVGGVPCAALGHGLEGPVVGHSYWGTEAVIHDLMRREGWEAGRVVLPATAQSAVAA